MNSIANRKSDAFFYYYSLVLLSLVVFSFGMYSILGKAKFNSASIYIAFHGVSMTLWYILLAYQSRLIKGRKLATHKRLGLMSIWLALAVYISGILIAITNYQSATPNANLISLVYGNFAFVTAFAIFYAFAFIKRKNTMLHKRMMIFASIATMAPALARFCRVLSLDENIFSSIMLISMLLVMLGYDIWKMRKIYWPTILAIVFLLAILLSFGIVGTSEAWANLVGKLFGTR